MCCVFQHNRLRCTICGRFNTSVHLTAAGAVMHHTVQPQSNCGSKACPTVCLSACLMLRATGKYLRYYASVISYILCSTVAKICGNKRAGSKWGNGKRSQKKNCCVLNGICIRS